MDLRMNANAIKWTQAAQKSTVGRERNRELESSERNNIEEDGRNGGKSRREKRGKR